MTATHYIANADVTAYFQDRGAVPTAWSDAGELDKSKAVLVGSEWLDRTYGARWKGARTETDQIRDWPRIGVTDRDGNALSSTTAPSAVRYAAAEAAVLHLQGQLDSLPARVDGTQIRSKSIGAKGITKSVEYVGGASVSASQNASFPKIDAMLAELLEGEGASDAAIAFGIGGAGPCLGGLY